MLTRRDQCADRASPYLSTHLLEGFTCVLLLRLLLVFHLKHDLLLDHPELIIPLQRWLSPILALSVGWGRFQLLIISTIAYHRIHWRLPVLALFWRRSIGICNRPHSYGIGCLTRDCVPLHIEASYLVSVALLMAFGGICYGLVDLSLVLDRCHVV